MTSVVFRRAHRILCHISSRFPLWGRNLNIGNGPGADIDMLIAGQTIYHDAARPSRTVLPIITAPGTRPQREMSAEVC